MDSLNDMKTIWLSAKVNALPESDKVLKTIKLYRTKQHIRIIFLIVSAIVLGAAMSWVIFFYQSSMLTTKIGEALLLLAAFMLFASNILLLRKMSQKNYNNHQFIEELKMNGLKQMEDQKKIQFAGFLLSSLGLLLYLFEIVYKQPVLMIGAYAAAVAFMMVSWFVLRPRTLKRKTDELKSMIQKLEQLSNQFTEY